MKDNLDNAVTLSWLTLSGVLYLLFSIILSKSIYGNILLLTVFLIDFIIGILLLLKLKMNGLTRIFHIYLFFFSGLGFTITFTVYLASYPEPMIGLGWVIFLTIILKIIADVLGISVEIEVSE